MGGGGWGAGSGSPLVGGASYPGSPSYGSPYGLSAFTPAGYTPPNFNPVSGGSTYAYTYDPTTGQGSYINSQGQPISYSSF